MSDNYSVAGTWIGSCCTCGISAPLTICFVEKENLVEGMLMIEGTMLVGSGPLTGYRNEKHIIFSTPGNGKTFLGIIWKGIITGEEIEGTYKVEPIPCKDSLPAQMGLFELKKS